ncbi:PREDICTED: uncharacterized protein LOC109169369 [Ipomoea nil]|uniref:uncharacterized protein LOC109169369 n=1 Tax=Ipomoea nil TaxID=35883 RepID=UPI000900E2F9|nr:PREDICTED: uncharacterized protein LOC109169369 [Ipomoea nil]
MLVPTELAKVEKFVVGLNYEARKALTVSRPSSLKDAYVCAADLYRVQQLQRRSYEQAMKRTEGGGSSTFKKPRPSFQAKNVSSSSQGPKRMEQGDQAKLFPCRRCGKQKVIHTPTNVVLFSPQHSAATTAPLPTAAQHSHLCPRRRPLLLTTAQPPHSTPSCRRAAAPPHRRTKEVESQYTGARIEGDVVTLDFVKKMMEDFKSQKNLHRRYAYQIVLQALPSLIDINVPEGKHFTVCGDVHG